MSANPYNPQAEKGAPYAPQDEYVQQTQNQTTGIVYTQQNQTTGIAYTQRNDSDTGISYAPRRADTTSTYPHEKGNIAVPAVSSNPRATPVHSHTAPVHSQTAPVHSQTAPVHSQTTPVHQHTAPVHPQTTPVYSQQPALFAARPGTMFQTAQHFTPPTGATQEWQHGLCGCFDSWSICMSIIGILNFPRQH